MIGRAARSEYLVLFLCAAYFAVLLPFVPGFASGANLRNIFSSMLPLLVVAVGQTLVVITGGIDLSVTSTIALASTVGALLMTGRGSGAAVAALAVMLAIGMAVGLLNGIAVTALRMPPFIVTLTTMMFFSGLAVWLTRSANIYHLPGAFTAIGKQTGMAFAVAGAVAAGADLLLRRSLLGRWLYAVGQNARTARVSGVPVSPTVLAAYLLSGACAAAASVLYTGRLETGSPASLAAAARCCGRCSGCSSWPSSITASTCSAFPISAS